MRNPKKNTGGNFGSRVLLKGVSWTTNATATLAAQFFYIREC